MPGPSLKTFALVALMLGAAPAVAQTVPALNVRADLPRHSRRDGRQSRPLDLSEIRERRATTSSRRSGASFPIADRGLCTQTATMGGTASYVELLTCLEMRRDARALPKDALTRLKQ